MSQVLPNIIDFMNKQDLVFSVELQLSLIPYPMDVLNALNEYPVTIIAGRPK